MHTFPKPLSHFRAACRLKLLNQDKPTKYGDMLVTGCGFQYTQIAHCLFL